MSSIIFCANVNRNIYNHFGVIQLQGFLQRLREVSQVPVYTAINISGGNIEERGKRLDNQINKILEMNKLNGCHLVGYSLAGLDARVAAHSNKQVKSIITIGTPNRGSILADLYFQRKMNREFVEPVCKILGVDAKYFEEANSTNISQFNLIYTNKGAIQYYSIGGHIYNKFCSEMFKPIIYHIEENIDTEVPILSDGVLLEEQSKWGEHLMTVEADHAMFMGIKSQAVADACASVVAQKIMIQENIGVLEI